MVQGGEVWLLGSRYKPALLVKVDLTSCWADASAQHEVGILPARFIFTLASLIGLGLAFVHVN
jgi:hypothetical protein